MQEATLIQILDNRENRAVRQAQLRSSFRTAVVSFTMNIAGPVKVTPLIERGFREGLRQLGASLPENAVLCREEKVEITGCEALLAVAMDAAQLKDICITIEEASPLGRLFDLDVIDAQGRKLSRSKERCCLICGMPGKGCAARRLHSVEVLQEKTWQILSQHFAAADAGKIGQAAWESLIEEVSATPKPGLVDRRNSGSHRDMTLSTFLASAQALAPFFEKCVQIGLETAECSPEVTFSGLREAGIAAQEDMLRATGGVNTHKGIIYSLGTICGAWGRLRQADGKAVSLEQLFELCAELAGPAAAEDFAAGAADTAGMRWFLEKGITGIRGEVARGFPSLREIALPKFVFARDHGLSREESGIYALLHLIAVLEDTTLLHRGGVEGARWAKEAAARLLDQSVFPEMKDLEELDSQFIARNLSPGGAADLLAVTFFLTTLMDLDLLQMGMA